MSGRMTTKLRHCRLQLKVGSIWNIHTVVQFGSFYSSASKQIGRKLDDWNPTNWIFSESCCIQISLTLFDTLSRKGVRAQQKRLTFDPPWALYLRNSIFDVSRPKIGRLYGRCIGIILKQIVCKIWISLTLFLQQLTKSNNAEKWLHPQYWLY